MLTFEFMVRMLTFELYYDISIFYTSKIGGVDEFYRCSRMAIPHNCSNRMGFSIFEDFTSLRFVLSLQYVFVFHGITP